MFLLLNLLLNNFLECIWKCSCNVVFCFGTISSIASFKCLKSSAAKLILNFIYFHITQATAWRQKQFAVIVLFRENVVSSAGRFWAVRGSGRNELHRHRNHQSCTVWLTQATSSWSYNSPPRCKSSRCLFACTQRLHNYVLFHEIEIDDEGKKVQSHLYFH